MENVYLADIGELGWSLYLSAHVRWLMEQGSCEVMVAAPLDRHALYPNVTRLVSLPVDFDMKFGRYSQDGFGRYGVHCSELKRYFNRYVPTGFYIPRYFDFRCRRLPEGQMTYAPYQISDNITEQKKILVFPRFRRTFYPSEQLKNKHPVHYEKRNIPPRFYMQLIKALRVNFPQHHIYSIGTIDGAYNILEAQVSLGREERKSRYFNLVGQTDSLQDLIDLCHGADLAIGGTSAPPKISMLQNVPTVVIGHEKQRFTVDDNWMNTSILFWEVKLDEYSKFNADECIAAIIDFGKTAK